MQDVSKKVRVLSVTQVKQSAGGVAIKAGVRAGLTMSMSSVNLGLMDSVAFPALDGASKDAAKM